MMLGHLKTAVTHSTGVIACHSDDSQWKSALNSKRVEAAWRLQDWSALTEYLKTDAVPSFETSLGQIIATARARDAVTFQSQIDKSRDKVMSELVALGMEEASYERLYKKVLNLHMLAEVERALAPNLRGDASAAGQHDRHWDKRLSMVQSSYRNSEQILSLRRCIESLVEEFEDSQTTGATNVKVGKAWVLSAKLARQEGLLQTAYTYILHAEGTRPPSLPMEKACLYWNMNQKNQALSSLEASLAKVSGDAKNINKEHAEGLLLAANWMVEVAKSTSDIVIRKCLPGSTRTSSSCSRIGRKVILRLQSTTRACWSRTRTPSGKRSRRTATRRSSRTTGCASAPAANTCSRPSRGC